MVKPLAALASRFRALKGLSLKETLSQFSHTMTAQVGHGLGGSGGDGGPGCCQTKC